MTITIRLKPLAIELALHTLYLALCYLLILAVFLPALSTQLYQFSVATLPDGKNVSASFSPICSAVYRLLLLLLSVCAAKLDIRRGKTRLSMEYWLFLCVSIALLWSLEDIFYRWSSAFFHQWAYTRSKEAGEFFALYGGVYVEWLYMEGARALIFLLLRRMQKGKRSKAVPPTSLA